MIIIILAYHGMKKSMQHRTNKNCFVGIAAPDSGGLMSMMSHLDIPFGLSFNEPKLKLIPIDDVLFIP